MHRFSVSVDDFYQSFPYADPRIDACMQELVARYDITGKSVLSVGAGTAAQERQFALSGNDLLLIDIDEHRSLLPILAKLAEKPGLSYWIGDAAEFEQSLGTYDVLYFSSFTPDEMRRGSMVRGNADRGRPWAVSDDPFHPVVMAYTSALKEEGLLIIQSYCGGIDTDANPDYLAACRRQLGEHGMYLMEVHRFKQTHGVMLYTAVKGKHTAAPAQKISGFHGRAAPEPTERIFAAGGAPIAPSMPPPTLQRVRNRIGWALDKGRIPLRYARLRLSGHSSANLHWKDYHGSTRSALVRTLNDITSKLPKGRWKTVIDHGCGFGRNALALRSIAERVWGIDVLQPDSVRNVDRYIRVEPGDDNCLAAIGDGEIDAVFVLYYSGFSPLSTWRAYLSQFNDRLAVYLQPRNFPRIIAKGEFLIFSEWEAEPEVRWGKASLAEIDRRSAAEYDPPSLEGFELITCGFAKSTRSPFVVYRRN